MTNSDYDPVIFLRCHSTTDHGASEVRVSVWDACFSSTSPNLVATCGGNKICLIDVSTAKVVQRYSSDSEEFFAVTWTEQGSKETNENILIAGSKRNKLYFICPSTRKQLTVFTLRVKRNCRFINNLAFHSGILYCAMKTGGIQVIGIKMKSNQKPEVQIKSTIRCNHEVFKISISPDTRQLFCATDGGLFGCRLYDKGEKYLGTDLVEFCLPQKPMIGDDEDDENTICDSVEVIEGGYIAAKRALSGVIYLWKSDSTILDMKKKSVNVTPTYILNWSSTDNYYMDISSNKNILTCGDDEGNIWLYDICSLKRRKHPEGESVDPVQKIPWPIVVDKYHSISKKLHMQHDDIVINKAVVSPKGQYIVAVTDRNTVCIWKRSSN